MAERRITGLVETLQPTINDVLPVVNTGVTKKVTVNNLVKASTFSNFTIRNLSPLDTSVNPGTKFIPVQDTDSSLGRVSIEDLYPIVISSSTINLGFNINTRNLEGSIITGSINATHFGTEVIQTSAIQDGAITEAKIDPDAKIGGATGSGTDRSFYLNDQTVNFNFTIPNGKNAMSAGPITIQNGVTVTVPNSSVWTVV